MNENSNKSLMLGLEAKSKLTNFKAEDFDPQKFINDLENNIQKINDFQNKGWFSRKFDDITGENTKLIIESLDLNNQFIQLSLWINLQLSINNNKIVDSQEKLKEAQEKITENHEKIDVTDSKLDRAVDTFNEMSADMDKIRMEMIEFKDLKKQINDQFFDLKKINQDQINNLNSLTNNTEIKFDYNQRELDQTKILIDKHLETFNKKYKLFIVGLILTSLLSLSAIVLSIMN